MTDLTMAELATREVSKLEAARAANRARFPSLATDMDRLARFTPRLIWAEQGGEFVGKRDEWSSQ